MNLGKCGNTCSLVISADNAAVIQLRTADNYASTSWQSVESLGGEEGARPPRMTPSKGWHPNESVNILGVVYKNCEPTIRCREGGSGGDG